MILFGYRHTSDTSDTAASAAMNFPNSSDPSSGCRTVRVACCPPALPVLYLQSKCCLDIYTSFDDVFIGPFLTNPFCPACGFAIWQPLVKARIIFPYELKLVFGAVLGATF